MLALTLGDPNGVGAEIIAAYLKRFPQKDLLIIGNQQLLNKYWRNLKNPVLDPFGKISLKNIGQATGEGGAASYAYLIQAIELAKKGEVDAIVTAPLNKEALHLAGFRYDGHTEILAAETGVKKYGMMFYSPKLAIMLTTIHVPLSRVASLITSAALAKTIDLALCGLEQLGINNPHLGVCGLNPHAGEGGLFGSEEEKIIKPIIKKYQKRGVNISGPYSPDTIFTPARIKNFDLVIAHYHDQGLIPLKLLAFDSAVNITVGLPIIRTSVDHGTAYDIVGQGKASYASLKNAVELARRMVNNRKKKN